MFCDYTAGLVAGVLSLIIGHPLDTIKTQQQVHSLSVVEATKRISHHRGWRGFYRGLTGPFFATGIINSIFFGAYADVCDYLVEKRLLKAGYNDGPNSQRLRTGPLENVDINQIIQQATYKEHFISGTAAGMSTIFICTPVELIKIKLQSQMKRQMFKGSIDCMRSITREVGMKALLRGIFPLTLRDGPGGGAYFVAYEWVKQVMGKYYGPTSKFTESVIAGGFAGTSNWLFVLPFDIVKTKMQADDHINPVYKNSMHVAKEIFRKDGVLGFYRGFWSVSARAFPVNASLFFVYEVFQHRICKHNN